MKKSLSSLSMMLQNVEPINLFKSSNKLQKSKHVNTETSIEPKKTPNLEVLRKIKKKKSMNCFPFCTRKAKRKESVHSKSSNGSIIKLEKRSNRSSSLMRLKNTLLNFFTKNSKKIKENSNKKLFEKKFVSKIQDSIKKGKKLIELKTKLAKKNQQNSESEESLNHSLLNNLNSKKTLKMSNLSSLFDNDSIDHNQDMLKNSQITTIKGNFSKIKSGVSSSNNKFKFFSLKKNLLPQFDSFPNLPRSSTLINQDNSKNSSKISNISSVKYQYNKKSTKDNSEFLGSFRSKTQSTEYIVNNFSMVYSKKTNSDPSKQNLSSIFQASEKQTDSKTINSIQSLDLNQYFSQLDSKN
jgi:hypothetical protein